MQASRRELEKQEQLLKEFQLQRKVKATVVPTEDVKVREMLRLLKEPVTLFGEREMERRDRLKRLLAEKEAEGEELPDVAPYLGQPRVVEETVAEAQELFYTEGSEELRRARLDIAQFSLERAKHRIAGAKRRRQDPIADQVSDIILEKKRLTLSLGIVEPVKGTTMGLRVRFLTLDLGHQCQSHIKPFQICSYVQFWRQRQF